MFHLKSNAQGHNLILHLFYRWDTNLEDTQLRVLLTNRGLEGGH